jgi:hypothetical protein
MPSRIDKATCEEALHGCSNWRFLPLTKQSLLPNAGSLEDERPASEQMHEKRATKRLQEDRNGALLQRESSYVKKAKSNRTKMRKDSIVSTGRTRYEPLLRHAGLGKMIDLRGGESESDCIRFQMQVVLRRRRQNEKVLSAKKPTDVLRPKLLP